MNEEIKKCLDSLYYQNDYCSISYDKLLNYITNLQKENKKLKEKVHNQKLANAYATIQNNKLQTRLKTYKRRKTTEAQKKRIYKSRNEKASAFLKHLKNTFDENDEMYELLNNVIIILQGGQVND